MNIEKLLSMLESPKADTRFDACEQLRVAPQITDEAIAALEKALKDPDRLVRESAQSALNVHKSKPLNGDLLPPVDITPQRNDLALVRSIALFILGATIGFVIATADLGSWFIRWQRMPQLPAKAIEIVSFDSNIFIMTEDGAIYSLDSYAGAGRGEWVRTEAPVIPQVDSSYPPQVTRPCDFSAREFNFLAGAPREISDCMQVLIQFPEASRYEAYIIDQTGSVWEWRKSSDLWAGLFGLCLFPILGGFAGLLLAAILPASWQLLKPRSTTTLTQSFNVLRWSARLFTIPSFIFGFLFFIVLRGYALNLAELLFFLIVCIGFVVAWWRERAGALLIVGALLIRFVMEINFDEIYFNLWYFGPLLVFTAPGFLFLVYWLLSRRSPRNR